MQFARSGNCVYVRVNERLLERRDKEPEQFADSRYPHGVSLIAQKIQRSRQSDSIEKFWLEPTPGKIYFCDRRRSEPRRRD